MKLFISLLAITFLVFSSCRNTIENGSNKFLLQGTIEGKNSGKIVLQYGFGTAFHSDTTEIKNGKFSFKGMLKEPTRGKIIGGDDLNRIDIYLEPGKMGITLVKDKFKDLIFTGSKSQEELEKLNKSIESAKSPDSVLLNFVLKNPKSYLTPYYLQFLESEQVISPDSLKTIFKGLDLSVQNSRFGRYCEGVIKQHQNTLQGAFATDFTAIDLNDQKVTLSQFKGKNIVLMDFWAITCKPCRQSIPHLKTLYKRYHSKGLEIIAVDWLDRYREFWISAMK